jgi:hypothetical protein
MIGSRHAVNEERKCEKNSRAEKIAKETEENDYPP